MIKNSARRLTLAVTFGLSTLAAVNVARAQSTITGTDPEPKSCGCKSTTTTPSSTTGSTTSSTTSTSGTVVQALLVLLGAA